MKKSNYWLNKRVLVTGGTGFIGSHVVEKLFLAGAKITVLDRISGGKIKHIDHLQQQINIIKGDCADLKTSIKACKGQQIVMNLAAHVGGIDYNRAHQATMLRDNLAIVSSVIEAARLTKVDRFLVVSSACVYPHDAKIPTDENEGFKSEPEPTNGGYGWSKRIAEKLGMYYAEEFGMKVGIVRPYNAYGPRDHFDPASSHVIPALIKRIYDRENPLIVWGSGNQSRAFLYVEDLADGMISVIEKYPKADPINLGTDEEVTIRDVVNMILKIVGKDINVIFDKSKPDGSPRRNSQNDKAKGKIGFVAKTKLKEGLVKTIKWYEQNYLHKNRIK
jgi:GDP-L-fucose synthase